MSISELLAATESKYWDAVAADPARIQAEVYSDLDLDECLVAILDGLGPILADNDVVLEIGCGPGRLTHHLADLWPSVTFVGVDSSQKMIDLAHDANRHRLDRNVLHELVDGRSLIGLGILGAFDAAYTMTTFQHIPPAAQIGYVGEVAEVLRPAGRFRCQVVTTGETAPFNYPTDLEPFLYEAHQVGFRLVDQDDDLIRPGWTWLTWEKT
jgi:cyclopropane fatty-acyl-phospholipid synthase-like methyltransferase